MENRCYRDFVGPAPRGAGVILVCCPWRAGINSYGGHCGEGKQRGREAWGRGVLGLRGRHPDVADPLGHLDSRVGLQKIFC
jgi:hypothetical protein